MLGPIKLPPRPSPRFHTIYELEFRKELGRGAFATVYEAYHRPTNTNFAVKKLRFSQLTSADVRNIENELVIHSQLHHKNIVQFIDYLAEPKAIFIILELVPRGNLFQYMKRTKLTDLQSRKVFLQVVQVLQYLHMRGIILRDLKPENILIDEQMNVKICDFGWATFADNVEYCASIAGTYCYMSPEGLRGELQTDKSDLWSLGVLLYELLFNKEPFMGRSPVEMLTKIYREGYMVEAGADLEAVELINWLLRANPKERASLSTVMRSGYIAKLGLPTGNENVQPGYRLNTAEGSKGEIRSKTSLKPVELIRGKTAGLNNGRLNTRGDVTLKTEQTPTKEQPVTSVEQLPALPIPPLASMGRKPFDSYPDQFDFSKLSHISDSSNHAILRAKSPELIRSKTEATPAPTTPQPTSSYSQMRIYKSPEPSIGFSSQKVIFGSTASGNNNPENNNFRAHPNPTQIVSEYTIHSPNNGLNQRSIFASPEPSTLRTKPTIGVDFVKRHLSPSIIASVNNSNIEVVFGDLKQDQTGHGTSGGKREDSVLRDLAVNRRMIFSSPASKPTQNTLPRLGSPNTLPSQHSGYTMHNHQPQFSPPPLPAPVSQTQARPQPKQPAFLDIIYKSTNQGTNSSNKQHPLPTTSRHTKPTAPTNLRPHPPNPRPPNPTATSRPNNAFGQFFENMKLIAKQW